MLTDIPCALITLQDLEPVPEPEETGLTFGENARLKATYYAAQLVDPLGDGERGKVLTVAEDSGLVVDALARRARRALSALHGARRVVPRPIRRAQSPSWRPSPISRARRGTSARSP